MYATVFTADPCTAYQRRCGEDRLHSILEKYKGAAPQVICEEVKRDVDAFVGEAPQFDDITMLALKYNGEGDTQCKS